MKRRRFVIGDLQGCFASLKALLKHIQFDPSQDFIYFAGDLVARGEDSLSCLRFVKKLVEQGAATTVLGNHDLTLIACGRGIKKIKDKDRTQAIFDAVDGSDLIDWLRKQPLLIEIDEQHVLTHAGIPHIWSLAQAKHYAREVEQTLSADLMCLDEFLQNMYGSEPDAWQDDLQGFERLRLITNYFTRMRLTSKIGRLELKFKEGLDDEMPKGFRPWFEHTPHMIDTHKILFGHWAALQGKEIAAHAIALDGGCVWGGQLIAYEIDAGVKHLVNAVVVE
ncbi:MULTISPECIES: symmetrical bis(5'-nucleosyl)-tetraphosphatase [unclassified Acinetobacter]|uniref:symmetrical bis(5'-nucleosyl)-tetraphosphatase n=1 Tax=unclassified Acinetobacter TaxID=196816 RepID=UPI0035BA91D4